jgi:hypothetical protein
MPEVCAAALHKRAALADHKVVTAAWMTAAEAQASGAGAEAYDGCRLNIGMDSSLQHLSL